jgi:hypothetical protein
MFKDAFGNTCDLYTRSPELCATAPMAVNAEGKSAATECDACGFQETIIVAQMWKAPWDATDPESEETCAPGACTMDSDCNKECPGSRCQSGVCQCSEGCESYMTPTGEQTCHVREDFGEPKAVVVVPEDNYTYTYWGFPLFGFILLLVMIGIIVSAVPSSKKSRRSMCFG